MSYINNLVVST